MKKNNNTTLSEHFQNPIKKIVERGKIDTTCTHKYTKINSLTYYMHFSKKIPGLN